MPICPTCQESFASRKEYSSHAKKCVQEATIRLPHINQTINLKRDEEGNFICHCSAMGCPKPFKYANSMRTHIIKAGSRWKGQGNPSIGKLDLHDEINESSSSDEGEGKAGGPSRASKHLHDEISEGDSSDKGKAGGPSRARKHLHDDISESDSRDFHQASIGSPIAEDLGQIPSPNWSMPQDGIMHSPPPAIIQGDVRMVSPTAHKSVPPQKSPQAPAPQLPSLMFSQSEIQAHNQNTGNVVPSLAQRSWQPNLPLTTAPGLISDKFLDSLNLAVNAEFHFLTCQVCEMALRAGEVKSHLAKIHGRQATYSDMTLKLAMASLEVTEQLPTGITGPRTIVHGLKVIEAMACSHCDFLSRSTEHLQKHHSRDHPMETRPKHWRACKVQHLKESSGELQAFWEVEDGDKQSQPTARQVLLKELEPTLEVVQSPPDGHMVSPWLLTTQWHEHLAGKNIKQQCGLVMLPKADDGLIPGLKEVVQAYYQKALSLLEHTGEIVQKRLNSPNPMKSGLSNTPFHKHLYESTMKQYIIPVVILLAMLIRQQYSGGPFSGSNPKLLDLLAVLRIGQEDTEALSLIHELLFQLWSTAWKHQGDRDIVDPTERCLALMTLREDGAFKEPHQVTPIIARLEYCMRLTFLMEIHSHMESDPQKDEEEHCSDLESFFVENTRYTFSHLGEQVDFADLCKVFEGTEVKLVEAWEQGILMGHDIRADYDRIAEDLVNKDVGYSFLSDVRNPQLAGRDRLVKHFLEDEDTFAHFAMIRQGAIIWNTGALQAWLKKYAELQSLLLLRAQMLSGAPSHGTELTAMTYRNTQTLANSEPGRKDKLIPHALDGITSDILVLAQCKYPNTESNPGSGTDDMASECGTGSDAESE
ncbi:hypothetical protein F5J12DRAFT_785376 [Pisolithus orientalis]|uniref:uncharacterized protein n=1 Tax=Pisolithus orientalis TaxID=936130 RepID=UPI002223F4A7|nr:uncharacterized protein F5J12DRAFT_785376 [Pisolithus orientalis]KAI5996590.1 hypothetical protein F5J12DRAFT_785376 [Pisolithus orientalis]